MKDIIVGLGEVLWDMLPEGKKLGGAPANFAYHVSQFGFYSCVVSAVGWDELGNEILESFQKKGLEHHITRVPLPTGRVEVALDDRGVPCYEIKENVAWDNIHFSPDLDSLAYRTRCVCFGSLAQRGAVTRGTVHRFLDAMLERNDVYRVFDINIRQNFYTKELLSHSISRCNVLKLNDEELMIISRLFDYPGIDPEETCRTLMDAYDLKILILTCGVNGSYVFSGDMISFIPTPRVEVVDTVGAGDAFTAAFCACLLKGRLLQEAHRLAVDVSAYVCTRQGAMPALPRELIERF